MHVTTEEGQWTQYLMGVDSPEVGAPSCSNSSQPASLCVQVMTTTQQHNLQYADTLNQTTDTVREVITRTREHQGHDAACSGASYGQWTCGGPSPFPLYS